MRYLAFAALLLLVAPIAATADDLSRFTILEENDSLWFKSDQHYTQGLQFSELTPDLAQGSVLAAPFIIFDLLGDEPDSARRYAIELGQSIFTPTDRFLVPPDPKDRPYAGWLYGGLHLLEDDQGKHLDHIELDVGIVGPSAEGEQVQNGFHQFIGAQKFRGWVYQLQDRVGGVIAYDRSWHLPLAGNHSGVDLVPEIGAAGGNVFDYGEAGFLLRIGAGLSADYGPNRIRPGLSGTPYMDSNRFAGPWGGYFFIGAQGRAVWRNIFLDGTESTSPHVDKIPLVGDLEAGLSVFHVRGFRIDIESMRRSLEFVGQPHPDVLCVVEMGWAW